MIHGAGGKRRRQGGGGPDAGRNRPAGSNAPAAPVGKGPAPSTDGEDGAADEGGPGAASRKGTPPILRPIICICNDPYASWRTRKATATPGLFNAFRALLPPAARVAGRTATRRCCARCAAKR